jgi:hypothetical protein
VVVRSGDGQGLPGTNDVVIHCPRVSCGKRLTKVTAALNDRGQVVGLAEGITDQKLVPKNQLGSLPPRKTGESLVRVVDFGGLCGVPAEYLVVDRASEGDKRGVGQPGPRTGYVEGQQLPWYEPGNPVPIFDEQNLWTWHCPCGARPRIAQATLRQLVGKALGGGEHHITLP